MKRLLLISPHFSTGGLPSVALKKIENLIGNYILKVVEYSDITAGIFTVQKNKLKSLLNNSFITLGNNKNELLNIIKEFKPNYIHFEEFPESFIDISILEKIYLDNRKYYITETTHDVNFAISSKKFLPDKFMHVSKYIANKWLEFNIPYEILEYPVEEKERPDRDIQLKKLGLNPEYKHVLNVGLFTPGKNQKQIFDIARKLQNEKIQFHFVGNQAGNFENYWKPLMNDKPSNCIIHGERDDVDNFYCCMDLFLFTSTYELNPIVIKEAISHKMKILMYNLEPYDGMYNNHPNIRFLGNNNLDNIEQIKNILYNDELKYPSKCYITHTTKNYRETCFGLIYSLLEYSKYPIIIFTVNFNISEVTNPFKNNKNVFFVNYQDNFSPNEAVLLKTDYGQYVDRAFESTYKILTIKSKIMLKSFELGVIDGVYLDSDSVCRENVDDLMMEIENVINYPLLTRGVYDVMLDNGTGDIERPLMDYLGVKSRSMHYVQSNIVVFNYNCKKFIEEWKSTCEDSTILLNFEKWAPYQDETIVNVLLWKYGYNKHLPMYHFNIRNIEFVKEFYRFNDNEKFKYSNEMMGFPFYINGEQMTWSYIPYDKNDVKVFHGIKNLDEMIDIIEYQKSNTVSNITESKKVRNKFCVIQTCDEFYKELADITFDNNSKYCEKNQYDYIAYRKNIDDTKTAHWQKYIAIKKHIQDYEWILYLDSDCMIMNYNIKLESIVDYKYDIIMENLGDRFDLDNKKYNKYLDLQYNPISSAMLLKNSKISIDFITDVYENNKIVVDGIYDNTSVRCLLGSIDKYKNSAKMLPVDSKILNSVWYSNRPSFIFIDGPKWNDNKNIFTIGDFILHLVAYDIPDRISLARQFLPYVIRN